MSFKGLRNALPVRLIELGVVGPAYSQAVYHALAERMCADAPDTVILTRPAAPHLCLGYHQPLDTVLDRSVCRQRGLPVLRRRVGGGATYLDADQLFYQFVFHHSRLPAGFKDCYAYTLAAPLATLRNLGLSAALWDVNEVEVGHKRIAGIGGGRIGEAGVVVGNFLLDFDDEAMAAAWRVPSAAFRTLARQGLGECVTTLRREGCSLSPEALSAALIAALPTALQRPVQPGRLSPAEERAAHAVAARLGSAEYLELHAEFHRGPMQRLKLSARGHVQTERYSAGAGWIDGSFYIREKSIAAALLCSYPPADWKRAERKLCGQSLANWRRGLI